MLKVILTLILGAATSLVSSEKIPLHRAPVHRGGGLAHHAGPVHLGGALGHHAAPVHVGGPVHLADPIHVDPVVPVHHAAPVHVGGPGYRAKPVHLDDYNAGPAQYNYEYLVHDDYAGTNFGHSEARQDYRTEGKYFVHLPDGRIQTVTYYADETGYHATVTYEGEAAYPQHTPGVPQVGYDVSKPIFRR